MDVRQYLDLLRKYLWLIVLCTLLAGGAAYYVSLHMTPVYAASATLKIDLANDPRNNISQSLTAGVQLGQIYVGMLRSPKVIRLALTALGLPAAPLDVESAAGSITVTAERDTPLIDVTVEDADPRLAQSLANQLAATFLAVNAAEQQARYDSGKGDLDRQTADLEARIKETQRSIVSLGDPNDPKNQNMPQFSRAELTQRQTELSSLQTRYTILLNSAEEFRLAAARYSDNVTVFDPAELPGAPFKPSKSQNTLVGLGIGLMVGVAIGLVREYLDDTLRSPQDVAAALELNTLGNIFRFGRMRKPQDGLVTTMGDRSAVAEGYRTLRTNLQAVASGRPGGCLLVTSAGPGEGKTTTAVNLAIVMAQAGLRVILVDSDLRRPTIGRLFDVKDTEGLSTLLLRSGFLIDGDLRGTPIRNLLIVPGGPVPSNPAELLASPRMTELVNMLTREADAVIFDSPPVLAVTDAGILAGKTGGTLLVVDAGGTRRDACLQAVEALEKAGANVLGAVLNKQRVSRGNVYYDYYDHHGRNEPQSRRNGRK